jgi:hypothetical protein
MTISYDRWSQTSHLNRTRRTARRHQHQPNGDRSYALLQLVADYKRLGAVQAAGRPGDEQAKRPQYPGVVTGRCRAGTIRLGSVTLAWLTMSSLEPGSGDRSHASDKGSGNYAQHANKRNHDGVRDLNAQTGRHGG